MDLPTRRKTPESALRAVLPRSRRLTGRQFQNLRPSLGYPLAVENRTGTIFQTDTNLRRLKEDGIPVPDPTTVCDYVEASVG